MRLSILVLLFFVCINVSGQTINLPMAPLNINLDYINKTDSLGRNDSLAIAFEESDDFAKVAYLQLPIDEDSCDIIFIMMISPITQVFPKTAYLWRLLVIV